MNSKQKFEKFLESLKGNGDDTLIESVKAGFQVCHEGMLDGTILDRTKVYEKDGSRISIEGLSKKFGEDEVKGALEKIGKKKFLENKDLYLNKIFEHLRKKKK